MSIDLIAPAVLRNARAGDLQSFAQLVRQHQAEIFGFALRLTGSRADALEVAQDAFIQLHTAVARIASPAHLRRWLLRAVAQRAADQHWQDTADIAAQDPGEEFTARVLAHVELRWSHRRADFAGASLRRRPHRRNRFLLPGMAIIGVAALLALWWPEDPQQPGSPATEPADAHAQHAQTIAAQPDADLDAATTPASQRPLHPLDGFPQYRVIVLPPRHASLDIGALAPLEALHAALLTELRKVPGITTLVPGISAPPDSLQSTDLLLRVSSLESTALPSGGTAFRIADGRGAGTLSAGPPADRKWPVEIRMLPVMPSTTSTFTFTLQLGEDSSQLPQLAARHIELLRAKLFPDVLVKQQLMAKFRDTATPAQDRNHALAALLDLQRQRGAALNPIDLGVIIAGAAAMPAEERAQLWRSLRGTTGAELVDTLIDSLRRDPDTTVRFEALATLAAGHGAEPRVRAAFEAAAREDPAAVLRAAAQRARSGEAAWRSHVISALKDSTLPAEERISPLLLATRSATTAVEAQSMRALLNDAEIVAQLAAIIREYWFDPGQARTLTDAFGLLAGQDNPPAFDLVVEIPRQARSDTATAMASATQLSPAAMSWLLKNRGNPRVRRMLDELARGSVSPQQVAMIEQMMQQPRPAPRRP